MNRTIVGLKEELDNALGYNYTGLNRTIVGLKVYMFRYSLCSKLSFESNYSRIERNAVFRIYEDEEKFESNYSRIERVGSIQKR